jgi:hypothetical protein
MTEDEETIRTAECELIIAKTVENLSEFLSGKRITDLLMILASIQATIVLRAIPEESWRNVVRDICLGSLAALDQAATNGSNTTKGTIQ